MKLVLVESPTKAKTINQYLGSGFKVLATYGHVRDLPQRKLGIDPETFEVSYVIPKKAKENIKAIKEAMKKATKVYLATDGDREGEAIAWHVASILKLDLSKPNRLKFFEVTKDAIKDAIDHPLLLDQKLVDAQQARRVLDRLVGYKLSPILWHKVRKGLSAGRVQSVALRFVVDREKAVSAFVSDDFFQIFGEFETKSKEQFKAQLTELDGNKLEKLSIRKKEDADRILAEIKGKHASIHSIETKISMRSPGPPLITSSLQQEASNTLGYSPKKTMVVAQQLYEGIQIDGGQQGLITYMRTDSHHMSEQFVDSIRTFIAKNYGEDEVSTEIRKYNKKVKMSQEAHEAIRPTNVSWTPEHLKSYLSPEQLKVYRLIWSRAVATQFRDAKVEVTKIYVAVENAVFEAKGEVMIEAGYLNIYEKKKELAEFIKTLPAEGEEVNPLSYSQEAKSTEPPARYTAASLIKALEDKGVGRPSTYAPTISTLTDRGYILIEEKKLKPTLIATIVIDLLSENFPFVVDEGFTSKMEQELDMIANGELEWKSLIKEFYGPFAISVEEKDATIEKVELPVTKTDEPCPLCGDMLVIKLGRFGEFMACERFPECKGKKGIMKYIDVPCPLDNARIIERKTKKGRMFYGCESFPKCRFASWKKPTTLLCPECKSMLLEKSKEIYICRDNKHEVSVASLRSSSVQHS